MQKKLNDIFFKKFFDESLDPFFIKDINGVFVYVNQAFLNLFDLNSDDIIGKKILDVFSDDNMNNFFGNERYFFDAVDDDNTIIETLRFKNGMEKVFILKCSGFYFENQKFFIVSFIKYENILNVPDYDHDHIDAQSFKFAPESLILIRLRDRMIIDVNDSALVSLQFEKNEIISKNFTDLEIILPEDLHTLNSLLNQYERYKNVEVPFFTKSGVKEYGLFSAIICRINGETYELLSIVNISDRKRKIDSLELYAKKTKRMFENIPMGFIVFDVDGNILHLNTRAYKLLGSPSKEATRAINLLTYSGLINSGISDKIRESISSKKIVFFEVLYVSKWGRKLFLSMKIVPLINESGKVDLLEILFEDVIYRKFSEEKLMESEQYYKALFDNTGMATVILDSNLEFIDVNEKFLEYIGKTKDLVKDKMFWSDFVVDKNFDELLRRTGDKKIFLLLDVLLYETVFNIVLFDEPRNFLITVKPIFNLKQYIVSMIDITEQKRIEGALRLESKTRKDLEMSINDGPLVVISFKNEDAWPINFVSKNIEYFFDYKPSDFDNGNIKFLDLVFDDDKFLVKNKLMNLIIEGVYNFTLKYRLVKKNNDLVWVEHKIWIEHKNGMVYFFRGVLTDITEQIEALEKTDVLSEHLGLLNKNVTALVDLNKHRRSSDVFTSILNSAMIISKATMCIFFDYSKNNEFVFRAIDYLRNSQDFEESNKILKVDEISWLNFVVNSMTRYKGDTNIDNVKNLNINDDIKTFLFLPLVDENEIKYALFFGFDEVKKFTVEEYAFFDLFVTQAVSILRSNKI